MRPSFSPLAPAAHSSSARATLSHVQAAEPDELVERARSGDRDAFRELFRRHRGDVARLASRMLASPSDVEDTVQEVFLQVHRSLRDFRGQARFTTWLHRITVNVILMGRRAAKARPVFAGDDVSAELPDTALAPDEAVSCERRKAAFRRVLDRLAEKKRTVFVLHEIHGLAPSEISEIVDAPVLTVRTRLFYARKELCVLMRDEPSLAQLADLLARDTSASSATEGT
jgi:RNA polymerase sigma-70 factor (ECF subfamily)